MTHRLKCTLLGTGSSGGVPRIGNEWGACDPNEPRNRRTRCSALIELFSGAAGAPTRVLIDTSPDMRAQLLTADVGRIDAVVYTHHHADQVGGIDDLRVLAIRQRARIPVYFDEVTAGLLKERAAYCFEGTGGYPSILDPQPFIVPGQAFHISGPAGTIPFMPLAQTHGLIASLGFRIGSLAYCNDVNILPQTTLQALKGVEVFIVDALRYTPHPSHATVDEAIAWSRDIGAGRTILTNMHVDLDYQTLKTSLPETVEPGYDGLSVELDLGPAFFA